MVQYVFLDALIVTGHEKQKDVVYMASYFFMEAVIMCMYLLIYMCFWNNFILIATRIGITDGMFNFYSS